MDISEEVNKIAMRNLSHNKSKLIDLKDKLENYLKSIARRNTFPICIVVI